MQADPHLVLPLAHRTASCTAERSPETDLLGPANVRATRREREDGFTLLEILIVVTIIGLLMGFLANSFIGRADEAKRTLAQAQVNKLSQALEVYRLDNGRYPTTEQGLEALVREPTIEPAPRRYQPGGYTDKSQLADPWGGKLTYEAPGRNNTSGFDICSNGPDGVAATGSPESDDLCNYDLEGR